MAARRPALVGAFVLSALALAVAGILFFSGSRLLTPTTYAVIYFEGSVAGLDVGSPVTFRGVRVGTVQRLVIEVSPTNQARIPVTVELSPNLVTIEGGRRMASVEQLVAAGLRAQLNLQSFVTGQLRIDLDFRPGTPAPRVADPLETLPQIPALTSDLERLRATLSELPIQELARSLQRTLAAVERLSTRLDTEIGPMLDTARNGVDTATHTLDTTQQAVRQLQVDASHTLQEADKLMADARQQLGDRGAELSRLLQSADQVARQADTVLASVNNLTAPRSELRGNLEAAARDLAATAGSLRGFARTIERDPSAVLRGRGSQ